MNQEWTKEIQKRVEKVPIGGGRSNKWGKISFDDLVFVPAQLAKRPVDYYREEINSTTIIGRQSKKPIKLRMPIIIAAMSFGALNKEAKIALAEASALAGTCANTGEGGMLEEEREKSEYLILQYASGRFGITAEILKKADAVEIKIGQGAKPGLGGFLPAVKVTEEIAKIRRVPPNRDVHSPAAHPDIKTPQDLKNKIEELREVTGGKPIILKLGACEKEDVELAIKANPDIIAIDGMEGGTGAAPEVMIDEMGIPTIPALVKARKVLDEVNASQELWVGGGLNKGGDMAKSLALGADAVFVGYSLLIAMGGSGENKAQKIANFLKNCNEEIKIITGAVGKNNIHDLSKDDLRGMNSEIARIAKVKKV